MDLSFTTMSWGIKPITKSRFQWSKLRRKNFRDLTYAVLTKVFVAPTTGVSKNADLTQYSLPDFLTLDKLSKIPVHKGYKTLCGAKDRAKNSYRL
jgi:hypothetical protein